MKINEIHDLTHRLIEEDWVIDFGDDEEHKEEFAQVLEEMYRASGEDDGALYEFFNFATNQKGSSRAGYEWDSKEFSELFRESFRGSDRDIAKVIKDYFSEFGDDILSQLISDRNMVGYFQWEEYVKANRPDLVITQRGDLMYLFEDE